MSTTPLPPPEQFIPLNGRLAIQCVGEQETFKPSIWRIIAMAPNANLEHHKQLAVGDLIICANGCYKAPVGTVTYIRPCDIFSIYPATTA